MGKLSKVLGRRDSGEVTMSTDVQAPLNASKPGKPPRPEHPTPHWRRPQNKWTNLNGKWAFAFDDEDKGLHEGWWQWDGKGTGPFNRTITVPYAHQFPLSGINDQGEHAVVWYALVINKPTDLEENRAILHFGAVDYQADVWVNGNKVAHHLGGHVPFHCDITDYLLSAKAKDSLLVVRALDRPYDVTQPRGKQNWSGKPSGIWYTPTTGIWQTVWIEHAPRIRIRDAILRPDIDEGTLTVKANLLHVSTTTKKTTEGGRLKVDVSLKGHKIASGSTLISNELEEASITLGVRIPGYDVPHSLQSITPNPVWKKGLALWHPDHPNLYDVMLTLEDSKGKALDVVQTYTGMRKIHIQDGKVYLNNEHLFQALNLDQGFWAESGLTAPSDEAFRLDIERMKSIGMNGCRKHQKVEDPRFLYWADKTGYLVWGEMPSPQTFSEKAMQRMQQEWIEAVFAQINFPCIISWTPFNESWGVDDLLTQQRQRNWVKAIYTMTKAIDPTRLCIGNDGWELQRDYTDFIGYHDYSEAGQLRAHLDGTLKPKSGREIILPPDTYAGQPILCTEFGGVSLKRKDEDGKGNGNDWGYNEAHDEQDLLSRMRGLVGALVDSDVCQGFCYTQTTDTGFEKNGILTVDRNYKASREQLHAIFSRRPKG